MNPDTPKLHVPRAATDARSRSQILRFLSVLQRPVNLGIRGGGLTGVALIVAACQLVPATTPQVMEPVAEPANTQVTHEPLPPPAIAPTVEVLEPATLWSQLRNDFRLKHHVNEPRVAQEIRWFQNHPKYFERLAPRMARYQAFLAQAVSARGMPGEIALLPIVESALDPYAFSHGGAAGLWQFIPATGERFGLKRNWWYDGRRDPVAATDAALDYLAALHARFDDWSLALAGYNSGEGNVSRALKRAKGERNFFQLRLPKETQAYVPRLLALSAVVADPERYGINLPELPNEGGFSVIDTGSQVDLGVVSELAGIGVNDIYDWNPALNQWATPPKGPHRLLLPPEIAADVQGKLDVLPKDQRVRWQRVQVRPGDTLISIARNNGTDVATLKRSNELVGDRIRAGQALLIPTATQPGMRPPSRVRAATTAYTVQPGDSLWSIAKGHNVSVNRLMKINHIGPKEVLRTGQDIRIPGSSAAVIRKVNYHVRRGDSLALIAGKFGVTVKNLTDWNKLDAARILRPGQALVIYVDVSKTI